MNEKVRENRLRRMARRQGLSLRKCRRRDPRAIGYRKFMLVNASNYLVEGAWGGGAFELTLDDVENWLTS